MLTNNMFEKLIKDLVSVLHEDAYLSVVIDNTIKQKLIDEDKKSLYTKLMYEVVDHKLYLDYMLSPFIKGVRVKPFVKCALRVGAYSIDNMNLKDYYTVNEICNAVKSYDRHAVGFVNAVLRKYQDTEKRNLPNNNLEKVSIQKSIPLELCKLLSNQYGKDFLNFFDGSNLPNSYRINTLKTNIDEVKEELKNIEYHIDGVHLTTKESLINTRLFQDGLIIAQDLSSMRVAEVVNPLPNSCVLDVCSAPGGKSLYMAALMNNSGSITSCDIYPEKLTKINDNAKKLGVTNIKTLAADATNYIYPSTYDYVLVDAPCSGLGTIAHKPDLKYRMTINDINDITNLQKKILDNASKYVKDDGILVYSTCTINKGENEYQIKDFLKNHHYIKLEEEIILPSNTQDGFYICKLKKGC